MGAMAARGCAPTPRRQHLAVMAAGRHPRHRPRRLRLMSYSPDLRMQHLSPKVATPTLAMAAPVGRPQLRSASRRSQHSGDELAKKGLSFELAGVNKNDRRQ